MEAVIEEELVWHTEGVATAAGYALLAFTCFVKIPLHCCQSPEFNTVVNALGSYRGPKRPRQQQEDDLEQAQLPKSEEDEQRVKALSQGLLDMAVSNDESVGDASDNNINHTEYEEVWAAESDPSDFEYESGMDAQQALHELDQWPDTSFDPIALSKPPSSTDWTDLRQAVANLLSKLTYSKLAPLSKQQWHSLKVSDLLTQLTLTLLIQPENSSTMLFNEELQRLGIQPLYCLRDRVASYGNVLGDYLTLVQTLVAVDAADPTRSKSVAPATIVGLNALSAVCYATEYTTSDASQRIRQCVLETSEDLAHIVEKTRRQDQAATVQVMWTLLPILDRLTNITPDGCIWESSSASLGNSNAQLLLQTGLFRELILLYTDCKNNDDASCAAACVQLLRSIQVMCIQSTSLLGKYAWRVPDLALIVQKLEFAAEQVVDGTVWNLLGTGLASGPVRMKLKGVPGVTADECRVRVLAGFERMCDETENAMVAIEKLRTESTNSSADGAWKQPIRELSRFCNYLVSCPSFATLWQDTVASDDETRQRVNTAIASLRNVLSQLPRIPEPNERTKSETTKSADNDKAGDPLERPASMLGEMEEAAVRKSLKILSASGPDSVVSSKTD